MSEVSLLMLHIKSTTLSGHNTPSFVMVDIIKSTATVYMTADLAQQNV